MLDEQRSATRFMSCSLGKGSSRVWILVCGSESDSESEDWDVSLGCFFFFVMSFFFLILGDEEESMADFLTSFLPFFSSVFAMGIRVQLQIGIGTVAVD